MTEIKVNTIPQSSDVPEVTLRIQKSIEDRNRVIAKRFGMKEEDVIVNLYRSKGPLAARIDPNGESLGVFAGYVDGSNEVLMMHPENVAPIFGDNLDKEMVVLGDYALTKLYMCKKYFPNRIDYKLYYKYLSEVLAQISAGNFKKNIVKFDIKTYFEGKKYRKEQEVGIVFHIMIENSGLDFIYEHLDKFVEDKDVKKTVFAIYKKSFSEFVTQIQRDILAEEKELQKAFNESRRRSRRR